MLPTTDPTREAQRERLARLLVQAMGQDVEGQRELIETRALGKTEAVYWRVDDALGHERELQCHFREETRRVIQCVRAATVSVRQQVARTRELIDLHQPSKTTIFAAFQT